MMRSWIDIVESGITQWTVDPDLDRNEDEMISKFTGYDREMRHYTKKKNAQFVTRILWLRSLKVSLGAQCHFHCISGKAVTLITTGRLSLVS